MGPFKNFQDHKTKIGGGNLWRRQMTGNVIHAMATVLNIEIDVPFTCNTNMQCLSFHCFAQAALKCVHWPKNVILLIFHANLMLVAGVDIL